MKGFEFEAPELISVGTQAMVERSDSLGLTWGLRPATVIALATATVTAKYDGDTEPIAMFSLVSGLYVGARVMAIKVPPSGNYILAFLDPGNGVAYLGANISTQGTVAATAAAETAVPSGSWDSEPIFRFPDNGVFEFHAAGGLVLTADGQVTQVSVRKGAGSTGGTYLWGDRQQLAQGLTGNITFNFTGYFANASGADVDSEMSLTIQKVAGGAGNVSLSGTAALTPLVLRVSQIGTLDSLASLAVDLISV